MEEIFEWNKYDCYKQRFKNSPEWFNIRNVLQFEALFNFIIGARGVGKTYSCLRDRIDHFLETGRKFIYLRRYDTEAKSVKKKMFTQICNDTGFIIDCRLGTEIKMYLGDPNLKDEKKRNKFKKTIGYVESLTKGKVLKSSDYSDVDLIIFDEFIIDKGVYRYLDDEVTYFLEYYETVSRLRDVTVVFLSNAITHYNPYFLEFNLPKPYGKKNYYKRNDFLVYMVKNDTYKNKKKNTRFGKLIEGTRYSEYAIDNTMLRDTNTFIAKHPDKSENLCNFKYKKSTIGVWFDFENECVYLSNSFDPSLKAVYRVIKDDLNPDEQLLNSEFIRTNHALQLIKMYFYQGRLFYESGKLKKAGEDIIRNLK